MIRKYWNNGLVTAARLKKKQTSADFIRSMSNEELAKWLWMRDIAVVEKISKVGYFTYSADSEKCEKQLLDWLNQEVEE